ncbi:hypothetical protein R1flu_003516 [Riccia fluitans]|uniref:Uncharacterized protein n=1 Tax=Riccia fluitans TaxID=41844 RepID=A0ABD1Y9K9_9MARC
MSRTDLATSMFLRSGCTLPNSAVDAERSTQWGHPVLHGKGSDFGTSEEQSVPNLPSCSDSWHGDGREWSFRENPHVKQPFLRSTLPAPGDGIRSLSSSFLMSLNSQPANAGANRMHSRADCGIKALQFLGSFSGSLEGRMSSVQESAETDKTLSQYTQELIRALQMGGSRTKMEAAIAVRSLAASHNVHQFALIAAGGLRPLVDLLSYEADETHWPPEMKQKATITVRAEAALALASLSVSNDENKGAIGAAGAIPRLCDLIQFDGDNDNPAATSYQKQEMAPFFVLARDAGAGALSCLAKNESNKEAMIAANAVPLLVRMVDQGTSFGRAAAANVLAKLATGDSAQNKIIIGQAGAIPALLRLIKQGSPKARETAAEALANLAINECNKSKILREGGIDCLLKMMESCSQAENDAAAAAVKVLQSLVGAVSESNVLTDDRNWSTNDNNRQHVSSRKKALRRESDTKLYLQEKKNPKDFESEVSASRRRGIMSMLNTNTNLNDLTSPLKSLQTVFTSELTSSVAPALVGQPSIQADSVVGLSKESSYLTHSRKRMKLSHPTYNICGPALTNLPPLADETAGVGSQTLYEGDYVHAALSEDRRFPCSPSRGRVGFGSYQGHVVSNGDYPNGEGLEPWQAAECAQLQPVSGGILALVNALSSQNLGAQEYSALALMLLASQGGYGIKTAIADAGALPLLISMVSTSSSPMIRESAAAAIAKLVTCHSVNRVALVRAGGVKALVEMAKWSTGLVDGAKILAAAVVAVLSLSEVLDRPSMQLGFRETLPALAQMLENDDVEEIKAGVGGLQALASILGVDAANASVPKETVEEDGVQVCRGDIVPLELVTSLLDLMRCGNVEAKEGAIESLASFRKIKSSDGVMDDIRKDGDKDEVVALRKEGLEVILLLLAKVPSTAGLREIVAGTFAYVVASERLQYHIPEASAVPHLMRLLLEGPTIATVVLAASAIANLGARKKCLETVSVEDIPLLLRLLTSDIDVMDGSRSNAPGLPGSCHHVDNQFGNTSCSPYLLLREHAAAILVYTTLSGEKKKESLIAAGAAPVFVQLLQSCVAAAEMNMLSSVGNSGFLPSVTNRKLISSVLPQATEEFAVMGLILLADKNVETMLKIVESGGIPTLVKLLSMTGGRGRLGASWSEMAAAALLTMSVCETAREEIIRIGGITSLVSVLKGDGGSSTFSVTGLAAMVQLLGVLAQNSPEAKIQMGKEGAVRCLVEILIGGGYLVWPGEVEGSSREGSGLLALAQDAAAAALATVVLHCPGNAEAAVEAGAIGPLVSLLGNPPDRCSTETRAEAQSGAPETESGASSAETGVTNDCSAGKVHPSTRNTSSVASEEDTVDTNVVGGPAPLAAMAALGNMISCYPQCGREVVDAGGLPRLLNLLQQGKPNPQINDNCPNRGGASGQIGDSKVRENSTSPQLVPRDKQRRRMKRQLRKQMAINPDRGLKQVRTSDESCIHHVNRSRDED